MHHQTGPMMPSLLVPLHSSQGVIQGTKYGLENGSFAIFLGAQRFSHSTEGSGVDKTLETFSKLGHSQRLDIALLVLEHS